MNFAVFVEVILAFLALVLVLLVAFRTELTRARGGKILAFIALFIFPCLATWVGFNTQMDRSESTRFCLSCHVMTGYGKSLYVDDPSFVPAVHFQNRFVPRSHACYTCHTDYAMFGGVRAKMEGLHHVYVQYFGTIPKPDAIRLYHPYSNRECLHCHAGMRRFDDATEHRKTPTMLADIYSGKLSCLSSHCHDTMHDIKDLSYATFWKERSPYATPTH
jgi:cytochrome c-type protein NapC